jgi:DNA-binding MarR family transcriptional regulator
MGESRAFIRDFRRSLRVLEREVGLSMASDTGCCGVTLAQCHLVLEVEARGSTRVTELADILDLDKSTLSRTVDCLCRAGLLNRETDPANRRQQVIILTEKGKTKTTAINRTCDASYRRLFNLIPRGKKKQVAESIALLAKAMRGRRKNPGSPRRGGGRSHG